MRPHDCPGCGREDIPFAKLACPPCWFRLPAEMRRTVNATWSSKDRRGHALAVREAFEWYRENGVER